MAKLRATSSRICRWSRARATSSSPSAGATAAGGGLHAPLRVTVLPRTPLQLGEAHEEFREAGADVVAIFQYRAEPTPLLPQADVPFDCLGDPEREGYHAVGLERGPAKEYIGPQLTKGFLRAARHGAFAGSREVTWPSDPARSWSRPTARCFRALQQGFGRPPGHG